MFVSGGSAIDLNQTVESYTINGKKNGSFVFEGEIGSVSANRSRIVISSGKTVLMSNRNGTRQKQKKQDIEVLKCCIFGFGNRVYTDEGNVARLGFIR